MEDTITVCGNVATMPRHFVGRENVDITSFRLASSHRYFDKRKDAFESTPTNWYTVTCFKSLAVEVLRTIATGQRVLVTGRLKIRDWERGDRTGTDVEIDAVSLGLDLAWQPRGDRHDDDGAGVARGEGSCRGAEEQQAAESSSPAFSPQPEPQHGEGGWAVAPLVGGAPVESAGWEERTAEPAFVDAGEPTPF